MTLRLRPVLYCLFAALTVWLSLVGHADAAGWLPRQTLSIPGREALHPDVAVDPVGNAWVVWDREVVLNLDPRITTNSIQAVRIAADGTAGPVLTVSGPDDSAFSSVNPLVAVDPAGRATIVWTHVGPTPDALQGVRVEPNGTIGEVETLGEFAPDVRDQAIVVDASGNATAVWGHGSLILARRLDSTGALSGPILTLNAPDPAGIDIVEHPKAAVGGDGTVQVAWTRHTSAQAPFACSVEFRRISAAGELVGAGPEGISYAGEEEAGGLCSDQEVHADAAGNATIEWAITRGDSHHHFVGITRIPAGATFNVNQISNLSDPSVDSDNPHLAAITGGSLALWSLPTDPTKASFVPNGFGAGDVLDVSDDLLDDAAGDGTRAALILEHNDGSNRRAHVAFVSASGALSDEKDVSPPGVDVESGTMRIAFSPGRTGVAAWVVPLPVDNADREVDINTVQVAIYDRTPPTVDGVAVSPAATTGQQLSFGASATDRAGVASYSWEFGDGATASSRFATHGYSAPGSYTVTLKVTDGVGNVATETRTIDVTAPSTAAGGGGAGGTTEPPAPQIKVHGTTMRVGRGGTFTFVLDAQPAAALGTVTVTASTTAARRITIARGQFKAGANKRTAVKLKLSKTGRKLLGRKGRLRVKATVSLQGVTGKTAKSIPTLVLRGAKLNKLARRLA